MDVTGHATGEPEVSRELSRLAIANKRVRDAIQRVEQLAIDDPGADVSQDDRRIDLVCVCGVMRRERDRQRARMCPRIAVGDPCRRSDEGRDSIGIIPRLARFKHYRDDMMGYAQIQGTRPKTLAYGLTDSPVGHLAWIVEKFKEWTNVSVNWFTRSAGSSANLSTRRSTR